MVVGQPQPHRHRHAARAAAWFAAHGLDFLSLELAAAAADLRRLLHLGPRRDQPRAVRRRRGRVGDRRRPHGRVLGHGVRDVLPRRVRQHDPRLDAGVGACSSAAGCTARSACRLRRSIGRDWVLDWFWLFAKTFCRRRPCSSGCARRSRAIRYDQIMRLGWKIFIPVTLVWLVVVGLVDAVAAGTSGSKTRPRAMPLSVNDILDQGLPVELHARRAVQGHARSPARHFFSPQDHDAVSRKRRRRCRRASAACTRCAATRTARSAASPASCARRCARRWRSRSRSDVRDDGIAPHDALRHRPDQVHLLRLLRGKLPGRLDRRDPHLRVPRREARRPVLHQGHAARRGRPLRERNRRQRRTADAKYR